MASIKHKGSFKHTETFFNRMLNREYYQALEKYAQLGAEALALSTPVNSGKTASSWNYEIELTSKSATIYWTNTNINDGVNIALILQYGHGTGTGGYVRGRDYINPAMRPIFDHIAEAVWKEVTRA